MSKTFENKANKAKTLAVSMKQHLNELSAKGVKQDVLDSLIITCDQAIEMDQEIDRIRMETSVKLKEANAVLCNAMDKYNELRSIIKNNYSQEQWSNFGLMDKR